MDAATAQKSSDVIEAVLESELQALLARVQAKEALGVADIKKLQTLQKHFESKAAPAAEVPVQAEVSPPAAAQSSIEAELRARKIPEPLFDWHPVSAVCKDIGCSGQLLKNLCHDEAGRPTLPCQKRPGRGGKEMYLVQPAMAYEFALRFTVRKPKGLKAPPGFVEGEGQGEPEAPLPKDFKELYELWRTDPKVRARISSEQIRAMAAVEQELRRQVEADAKRAGMITPEDHRKAVRSFILFWCGIFEDRVKPRAGALITRFKNLGVDLVKLCPMAFAEVEDSMREQAQDDINALQKELDARMLGPNLLTPEAGK